MLGFVLGFFVCYFLTGLGIGIRIAWGEERSFFTMKEKALFWLGAISLWPYFVNIVIQGIKDEDLLFEEDKDDFWDWPQPK
jgi:hypothetical protein